MQLPPELHRRIAEYLRECRDSNDPKSMTDWRKENDTLLSLSLVSKMWMHEARPVLWSEIVLFFVKMQNNMSLWNTRLSQLRDLLRGAEPAAGYAIHVKRFSITILDRSSMGPRAPSAIIASIFEEVFLGSRLREFHYDCLARKTTFTPHLSNLHLPHLRTFYFRHLYPTQNDEEDLATFLTQHTDIHYLVVWSQPRLGFPWESLREADPLPNLRRFEGELLQMRMFSSAELLTHVHLGIDLPHGPHVLWPAGFIHGLTFLQIPFPNVFHFSIQSGKVTLGMDTARALDRVFPALGHLSGFEATPAFFVSPSPLLITY